MDKNLIKKYAIQNRFYYLDIEGYLFPRFIEDLNINDLRAKLLSESSSFESSFVYDCQILQGKAMTRKKVFNFIREFPIPIEDRDFWNTLLTLFEVEEDHNWRKTKCFFLDFLFPTSDLAIEIDSSFHKDKEAYDKARDMYLKTKLGIKTVRFFEYGKDPQVRETYKTRFRKELKISDARKLKFNLANTNIHLDFSESIMNNFIKDNLKALIFIESVEKFVTRTKFLTFDVIYLKKSQLKEIAPKHFKGKGGVYEEKNPMFLTQVNFLSKLLYEKEIKVLGI